MNVDHTPLKTRASRFAIPSLAQIFRGPLANRFRRIAQWRKHGLLAREFAERRRAMRFEALEPRLLLSADLTHDVAAGSALDATLTVADVNGAAVVQLVDNGSSAVLEAIALDQDINVSVHGADMADRLAIGFDRAALAHQLKVLFDGGDGGGNELVGPDHGHSWQLGAPDSGVIDDVSFVSFSKVQHVKGGAGDNTFVVLDPTTTTSVEGGSGSNTLVAADQDNAWTVSGTDSGTLNGESFSNVQNLEGGAGNDTVTVAPGGKVSGSVSGGAGSNTLVASDQDNAWTVSGTDSGTLNGQAFSGMQNLSGGAGQDTFTLAAGAQVTGTVSGGGGNDTLVGADQTNAWTISGTNSGSLNGTVFADIENLAGGSGDDTFTFTSGGQLSGTLSGGDGNDTLAAADGDNVWVISGANAGTLNGQSFAGIENLRGGAGADTFVFAGGSLSGSIDGGAGANTFDYSALASAVTVDLGAGSATGAGTIANLSDLIGGSGIDTLKGADSANNWAITGPNAGSVGGVAFSGIENLDGGAGADTFVFDVAGALDGGIDGGAGSDTVAGANKANLWNVNGTDAGTLNGIAYASVENLLGGSDNDTFALMAAGVVSGGIEGGLGADTVRGPNRKTVWRFTGQGKGNVGGVASFTGMESVQGGTDDDTFAFDNGADFGGTIDGGGGIDTLDYSAYTTSIEVDLAADSTPGASAFSGISGVIGGAGTDTLKGPAADSTWTVSGANSGDVGGVNFSSFENLQGAANNQDTFVVEATGSESGVVDGGAGGFDSLVLDGGTFTSVTYNATGNDSGTVTRDGDVITYAGLEPVTDNTSSSTRILTFSDTPQTITVADAGSNQITVQSTESESVTFANPTVSLEIDAGSGSDTIVLKGLGTFAGALQVKAGDGNDTVKIDALTSGVTYAIDGGSGTDTVTFDATSGGFTGALSLVGSTLTGGGSTVTLQSGTIEKIDDANVNAAADALKSLLGDLEKVSDAARKAVALGGTVNEFASQLPLLFGGDQNTLNLDNVVAFADAIDAVRADLHSYYVSLKGADFTLNDLQSRIRGILDGVIHYAGSVVGDFAPTLSATDTANIKIALDGGNAESLSFKGGTDLNAILGNITAQITANSTLNGKIGVYDAGGHVAFKVNDPSVTNFTVSCLDTDNAFTMLGLRTSLTMKAVEPALGSLTGSAGKLVQLADTWITFDSGTPKLSIDLPFNLSRTDTFGLDFGKAAHDLHGLNFDATAQITATATVAADLNLGLTLDNAHTFDVTVNSFSARAEANATLAADVSFGFLGAHVGGPIDLDAGVALSSPLHLAMADLQSGGLLGSGGSHLGIDPNHHTFTADFQVSVLGGLNDGGSAYNPSGLELKLDPGANANPFDPSTFSFDKFTKVGDFTNLFNFNNLSPAGMITLLKKLAGSLDDAANSNVFSASNIPFVGGTISDALDLVKTAEKAILFDDGGDGTDDGTALVTDLNNALATATDSNGLTVGLSNRFLVQGDGTKVSLIATDGSITGFSASGLSAVGIDGSATFSDGAWRITGTPSGFGADGTLTLVVNGTDTYHVTVTGTGGNAKIGNDVPKLVNAAGAPTFHSAQDFASHLATLLGLAPSDIGANFDSLLHALTFHLKFDAPIPALTLPVNFNLDLGSFAGVKSDGTISITPDAGIDLTFGVDLGAGGGQLDDTKNLTTDLTQPVDIPVNPAFTGADVYTVHDRLSSDASFKLVFGGHSYAVTVTKVSTDQNATIGDLVSDLKSALKTAQKDDGTVADLTSSGFDASNDGSLLVLSSSSAFTLQGDSKLGFLSKMDAVSDGSKYSVKAANAVPDIVGNLPADASFTIQMANSGPSATIQVQATATAENRTVLDLLNDVRNALASSAVKDAIEVDTQGNALVFKSKSATSFTIIAGTGADKLGLSGTHDSNTYDLVITLSDGSKYSVALKTGASPSQTACATIGDVKAAIERDTQYKVTVGFNTQGTALLLTDTTFPSSGAFRVEAINGSGAGGKLGIVASDSAGPGDAPDGKITGAPIVGMPLADRLFIKAPGNGDPSMLHASLSLSTGSGITADAFFGFVGVHLVNSGEEIDASLKASLKDPNSDGRITLGEIAAALTSDPTSLVGAPTLDVDPQHNKLDFTLTVSPSTSFFNPSGTVTFTVDSLIPPHVSVSADSNLDDLFKNFGDLSFDNILAVLTQLVVGDPNNPNDGLAGFLSAGPLGSFKIPLLNVSVSDLVSNLDKFTSALQSLQSNPAGSLQKLGEKLTEALGVPTTLSLEGHKNLEFKFSFSDDFSKGLNLTIPANLLPTGFQLSGAAGLEFGAHLDLSLDFGIDLSSIDPLNPTALPSIYVYTGSGHTELSGTATIKGDDLNFLAGIGPLAVSIENGSAEIDGHFKVTTSDNDGPSDGKVSLTSFLGSLNADLGGTVSANLPVNFNGVSIGSIAIADFTDPNNPKPADLLTFDPVSNFKADLTLPDLSNISLFDDLLLSGQGIDLFLGGLQDLLSGKVFGGTKIPLIGDQLAQAGKFIEKLRNDFVAPYEQAIQSAKNAADNFAKPESNVISGVLFDLLGPGTSTKPGLGLLQKLANATGDAQQDYVDLITNLDKVLAGQVPQNQGKIEWDFTLGGTYDAGPNVNLDLGIPGLGLSMDGTVDVKLNWTLHLGIGFNYTDGFYLVIGDPKDPTDTNWKDLDVGLNVAFADGFVLSGQLGFLQLTATNHDLYQGNDKNFTDSVFTTKGTGVTADFAIDLTDGGSTSNHLPFADIGNLQVTPQVKAAAALEASLSLGLNPGMVGDKVASGMPKILADLVLDWSLDYDHDASNGLQFVNLSNLGDAMQAGLNLVDFSNLRLDVGSFVSDVLGPIVEKVKEATAPFQPIIDIITSPIPVISDLAGSPITLLDLAANFGHVDKGFIYALADIIDFVNSIPDPGKTGGLEIPLMSSDFKLYNRDDSSHTWDPGSSLSDKADDLINSAAGTLDTNLEQSIANMSLPSTGDSSKDAANKAAKDALSGMFSGKGSAGEKDSGFSFPLLKDPKQILYLLMGKNSDIALVEYRMPKLDFEFDYSQFFPIFGPLGVSITGTVGLTIDFGFGYDTRGIREFVDSKATHPELLVDGFYLTDLDTKGNDIPELTLYGGIAAAAELNLGIAQAGVAGGIGVQVDFNLHDNDHDGKVRLGEMAGNIYDEAVLNNDPVFAPLAIFDVTGAVFAQLSAFLKIDLFFWQFDQSWNITPKITLVDFSIDFGRVPKLATLSDSGELRLNMGPYANSRLNGDLTDVPEDFTVTHVGGSAGNEDVKVSATIHNADGTDTVVSEQTYKGVQKLIIDGGEGVDKITVNGVLSKMDISGGAGDDVIDLTGSLGDAVIHGDAGDDTITGGDGNDVIYGGLGSDHIYGGKGNDIVFADGDTLGDTYASAEIAGNDSKDYIWGGKGDDILFGAGGDDEIHGEEGNDILIGDAGTVALKNGAVDWSKGVSGTMTAKTGGNDTLYGGPGDDYLFGGAGDDKLYGDDSAPAVTDGNDRIFGEAGFDEIHGGGGNDIIFGDGWSLASGTQLNESDTTKLLKALGPTSGGEKDSIWGDAGDDVVFGGGGNDTIRGGAGNDTLYGGTGADSLFGDGDTFVNNVLQEDVSDGNDAVYGQSENDVIYGGGGNDLLSGDAGNDKVYGGSGTDSIYGGFGSDTLDGETAGDLYYIYTRGGTAAEFTTIYDSGALVDNDSITVYGTSENDVFLLRAMADAYIPTLDRLHTLIEKFYKLGKTDNLSDSDILKSIEDAITRVYTPNAVPDGMLDAVTKQFNKDPNDLNTLKTSVDASYVPSTTATAFVAKLNNDGKAIERFNYRNIEAITLNTLYGDDYVASDDTLAVFTINGGEGNDRFQIGQVFNSVRDTNHDTSNLSLEDVFATLEITRGWLSNGISKSMTINGGGGNDDFTVFHNTKSLTLNGGDGDDTFTVRAFALVGSVDDQRARTDMKGDGGADTIKYAVNAPVSIDGGDGFDTVQVIGTEFSDDFVITDSGVFGAGLNVTYVNIEKLKVDGAEGDDRYFVLSTDANVVTEIDGGLGSDTFFTGGSPSNAPIYVTSNDLRGYNGIILNSVENNGGTPTGYEGVAIDGIAANVADNEEPFIVVSESGGFSSVTEDIATPAGVADEGWAYDTYTVTLTKSFVAGEVVHVHVLPQEPSPEDAALGFKTLEFKDGANWVSDMTLTFTSAGTKTVEFRAAHDTASEGKQFAVINHDVDDRVNNTTPGQYDGVAVRSVKVQINDDDRAGVIITRTERPLQVIEGNSAFDQTYAVVLTRAPTNSNTVDVTLDSYYDQVSFSGTTLLPGNKLHFDGSDYNTAQFVTVTPIDDSVKEGFHTDYISHTVTSGDENVTKTQTRIQLDGDPAVSGVNDIPTEKPLDSMLLADRPVAGTMQVWVDNVARASNRFLVDGNTLVFIGPDGTTPEAITGKVEVQYDYVTPGYDGALADRQVVDIADNDVASVVVIQTDGSTDVVEGGATDTYQLVLTQAPEADVTIRLDSFNTRTGGLDPDTLKNFAYFEQHVKVNGQLSATLTFTTSNWKTAQTVTVSAIDDGKVDGDQIQAFVPSVPTLNKIRGPLFLEGASGSGSLSLPAPLLLPRPLQSQDDQEKNLHPSDGTVVAFTPSANPGPGAIDQMTVATADLQKAISELNDSKITQPANLVGKTLQITQGPGTGIVLDASQPRNLYDRFWLITKVVDDGTHAVLTLQNPSQVDTSDPAVKAPDSTSKFAISSLSINFFADERQQVDYMFVYDQGSVADKVGRLTSSDGMVIGFDANAGTMTVATADLLAASKNFAKGIDDLLNKTLRITAGPGLDRSWNIAKIEDGAPGTKVLTLSSLDSSTEAPTALSEFSIAGAIVKGRLSGFGMGPNTFVNGFAEPGGVRYGDIEVVQANLGTGDDHVTVDYTTFWKDHTTKRDDPFYTLTMLNTGLGNDTVTVNLADGQNGAFALNTQEGNDIVHGENSTLPLVVFGWDGNDEIHGGSGADILFGDRGRVDYVNGDGLIVTRLGQTWEQSKVNPPETFMVTGATASTLTDSSASFPTAGNGLAGFTVEAIASDGTPEFATIKSNTATELTLESAWTTTPDSTFTYRITLDATSTTLTDPLADFPQTYGGLVGLSVQAISADGLVQYRRIISNTATTLTIDHPWDATPDHTYFYRVSMLPEDQTDGTYRGPRVAWTIDGSVGGSDTIYGGGGGDTIFGGAGKDEVHAGAGADWVIGDNGRIDYAPVTGNDGATVPTLVQTTETASGDNDTLFGDDGTDILVGGTGDDKIDGGAQSDVGLGDQGTITLSSGKIVSIVDPGTSGDDTLAGGADADLLIGGLGNDTISGQDGSDILIGDEAQVLYAADGVTIVQIDTIDRTNGGTDTVYGGGGDDIVIGGANADNLDGGTDRDLIFGDNVLLVPNPGSGDSISPRFRALKGTAIYDSNGLAQVGSQAQPVPGGMPAWADWHFTLDQSLDQADYGNDYIAGGAGDDEIFGQLGNDTIQGDGSIDLAVGAARDPQTGVLTVTPSVEDFDHIDSNTKAPVSLAGNDGNDYIEGNGGNDVIFGNLGQDDLIGGSSSLFSLGTGLRQDSSDLIFGGAGTEIARNDPGRTSADGHARDSDMIVGDNGNIYRLVGTNGANGGGYLTFNYDNYGSLKIIPRAAELLDYTPGGPDYLPLQASADIGGADEIHGESGDDFIYGQKGNDVIYGDGQDDDIVGGYGNDWISGGTGDDGVLGDDGRIFTSRNGTTEPLNGVTTATVQSSISTPGNFQQATINVTGTLTKAFDITPFSQDTGWTGGVDEFNGVSKHTSDDIIYGGLGNDWLHGGSGDDAISGAEALPESYLVDSVGVARSDFGHPYNPGNALHYNAGTGTFVYYDEYNPMRQILLNDDGTLSSTGTGKQFFLNFNASEGQQYTDATYTTPVYIDGADKIFGDNSNDWLVGGTGRDDLYGGWGDDLINADDDQGTDGGLNDQPDTNPTYEDRAYGGAGRDVLIANTGGDRLIDWVGEFNSYIVPFAPFGMGTVSRTLQPQLQEFLYSLSASDGADPTRATDTGADPTRNGEPMGELGVVVQKDNAWQDQTGGPRDVQAGNIPGGKRDVLRSASFDSAQATSTTAGGFTTVNGFSPDSGKWSVQSGVLQVSASSLHGDAVSVFDVGGDPLPGYFEVQASVMAGKPTSGWNANGFIIFDYQNKSDFKFAGLDVGLNKLVMGHRDATGWHVDDQASVQGGLKAGTFYNMLLAVNGVNATLVVNNQMVFTYTYQPRVVSGYSYGLNSGMVGVGSNNSQGAFDNVVVQVLPPQIDFDQTVNFDDGTAPMFTGYQSGAWSVGSGVYSATPGGTTGISILDIGPDNLQVASFLQLTAKVTPNGRAGFAFDRYADGSFKFVALDSTAGQVVIGHYTPKGGWASDAVVARTLAAGTTHTLDVALKGTTVSVTLDGQVVLGYAYNAATVDGRFGLLATGGSASFDDVRIRTNDPAFAATGSAALVAASAPAPADTGTTLTQAELDSIATVAISQWTEALGSGDARLAALADVHFGIADLAGSELGDTSGSTVLVDVNAAGFGWFVDSSPASSSEFRVRLDRNILGATADSPAYGHVDLVTVVEHEIGHLLGFEHTDAGEYAVMNAALDPGVRELLGASAPQPVGVAPAPSAPAFDTYAGDGGIGAIPTVDWKADANDGWSVTLSPYDTGKPAKNGSNIAPFDLNSLAKQGNAKQGAEFDSLGRALLGERDGAAGG